MPKYKSGDMILVKGVILTIFKLDDDNDYKIVNYSQHDVHGVGSVDYDYRASVSFDREMQEEDAVYIGNLADLAIKVQKRLKK